MLKARHFFSVTSMCGTFGIPLSASPSQAFETLFLHRKVCHDYSMQWNMDSCSLGEGCLHHDGCKGTAPDHASVIYMIKAPADFVSALIAGGHFLTSKANKLDLSILDTELHLNGENFKVSVTDTPGLLKVRCITKLAELTARDLEEQLDSARAEVARLEAAHVWISGLLQRSLQ